MKNETMKATNKKAGKGNGNSVINNYERPNNSSENCTNNSAYDYVSGDAVRSSSGHKFSNTKK